MINYIKFSKLINEKKRDKVAFPNYLYKIQIGIKATDFQWNDFQ